jgi:hypothetical protein
VKLGSNSKIFRRAFVETNAKIKTPAFWLKVLMKKTSPVSVPILAYFDKEVYRF